MHQHQTRPNLTVFCFATIIGFLPRLDSDGLIAEEPGYVERTFAVIVPLNSTLDFTNDESIGLVVAPRADSSDSFMIFVDQNVDPNFNSTIWIAQPATHISSDGAEIPGTVYWLLTPESPEPPPLGSFTFTGPESDLIQIERLRRKCANGDCGAINNGKYHIADGANGDDLMIVVTAQFLR